MLPRCCESAGSSGGDADRRGHHEEGGSYSEDHPTLLCGHADNVYPPMHPSLLHGLSHTKSLRGQSLPDRTVWVSEKTGGVLVMILSFLKGVYVLGLLLLESHTYSLSYVKYN